MIVGILWFDAPPALVVYTNLIEDRELFHGYSSPDSFSLLRTNRVKQDPIMQEAIAAMTCCDEENSRQSKLLVDRGVYLERDLETGYLQFESSIQFEQLLSFVHIY